MSLQKTMPAVSREASSALMRDRFIAPQLLPVCCLCGLFRDETAASPGDTRWITQRTYRQAHGVNPNDFLLTHTYCPACFTKVLAAIRQHFKNVRTAS